MKVPNGAQGRAFSQAPDSLRREARIRASEVKESAFAMRDVDIFSKMGASHARWRLESGSTTSPLISNQDESASSRAGFGVLGKAAVGNEVGSTRNRCQVGRNS